METKAIMFCDGKEIGNLGGVWSISRGTKGKIHQIFTVTAKESVLKYLRELFKTEKETKWACLLEGELHDHASGVLVNFFVGDEKNGRLEIKIHLIRESKQKAYYIHE